jgi:6-phosphogluconolactonase
MTVSKQQSLHGFAAHGFFGASAVAVFAIDPATGSLSAVAGSPFGAGAGAISIAIDPAGTFAYVANETAAAQRCSMGAGATRANTLGIDVI